MVKILQCCDKLVTNMTLWSQGCSELVKLLHGCDEVVARLSQGCHKVVTRLSQACDKVAGTLQPCHNLVISVWDVFQSRIRDRHHNCPDVLAVNNHWTGLDSRGLDRLSATQTPIA